MTGLLILVLYLGAFFGSYLLLSNLLKQYFQRSGFNSLKTVTFGDESAVRPNLAADERGAA